jgi:hypothetical protein
VALGGDEQINAFGLKHRVPDFEIPGNRLDS